MSPADSASAPDRDAGDGVQPPAGQQPAEAPPARAPGDGPAGAAPEIPPPSPAEVFAPKQLHSSLTPRGEHVAWSALGSLLAGPIVWGGVGYLLDRWLGTGRTFTAIGVVVGSLTAFYIVYLRFGREE